MPVFDRIKYLAKKQGKSVKDVARDLDFGESTIYKWKTQSPKGEYLGKVADYFGVTTDYLLGRTDDPRGGAASADTDLDDESAIFSFDGKPVTEEERLFLKSAIEAYRKNKK